MKYASVLNRVRNPELKKAAADRIKDARSRKHAKRLVSDLLRMHLVQGLCEPEVRLCSKKLPQVHEFDAGAPATSFPNDTYPQVFERVLRSYTEPGDRVLHVFTRSSAPIGVAKHLGSNVVLLDEYVSGVGDLLTPDLLAPSEDDLSQIGNEFGFDNTEKLVGHIQLLHLHLPLPGIVRRLELLGNDAAQYGRCWERMNEDEFWNAVAQLIETWTQTVRPKHLTIQCGHARWSRNLNGRRHMSGQLTEMFPKAIEVAQESGWKLNGHWRLRLNPVPGPARAEELRQGWLLAFRNGGKRQ